MAIITINVQNNSTQTQTFLYFMSPISVVGMHDIYCTSLGAASLGNYKQTGTILTFELDFEYRAGVQQAYRPPVAGQQSGYMSSSQAINLSTGDGKSSDVTVMQLKPLALLPPSSGLAVPAGAFRITTADYDSSAMRFNAGTALRTYAGGVALTSFIEASPNTNIDISPSVIFNVAIGNAATGVVITPASFPSLAVCNATYNDSFYVVYGASGKFSVTGTTPPMVKMAMAAAIPRAGEALNMPKRIRVRL
ncbi:hypothetical protein [Acidisoma silvae]|uniref:Uncharacterized protein n=1 Tax=Acidisoma silvae TaxID=2802396 RepID=A0A964E0Y5_9PROT|nr:hypothetical protein [Acidisoma silvae]MCB8877218.1 hypothetical protein [Acidisoma silvae]